MTNKKNLPNYQGKISLSRVSCSGGVPMFGSSIRHSNYIAVRISRASTERQHSTDYVYREDELIEVRLSPAQFAEMITSMNTEGVPCTISTIESERMDTCNTISEREKLVKDFEDQVVGINKSVTDLLAKINEMGGKMSKKAQDEMKKATDTIAREMSCNLPFVRTLYDESVEKVVTEAKAEIEAFILHRQLNPLVEHKGEDIKQISVSADNALEDI